jgi:lipopolysaccharide/colanic/teichoic acid biosynthesis glycosyltransferase
MKVSLSRKKKFSDLVLVYSDLNVYPNQSIQSIPAHKRIQLFVKRVFDIIFSFLLIIIFSPILVTVAVIIKATSRGSIFYSNERVGLYGIHFKCFKFRSMVADQSIKANDHAAAIAADAWRRGRGGLHRLVLRIARRLRGGHVRRLVLRRGFLHDLLRLLNRRCVS